MSTTTLIAPHGHPTLGNGQNDTRIALKFITCGSVDDGKSTLIGRLLVDSKAVLQDHLAGVQRQGETDLALLTDGLQAEREQIGLPSIYYTHRREVVDRRGLLVPVTGLTPPRDGETVQIRDVRFRTVGDITCTCPVESLAATPGDIVIETLAADVSERGATRMDDKTSEASMEKRKKDGYF